jgi:hypothetical protein
MGRPSPPGNAGRLLRLPVRRLLAPLAVLLLASPAWASEKTDVVVLVNGDRITGEIKGMTRNTLDYKTDDAGRLSIEWNKVVRVTSPHYFEVELSSGKKHYGRFLDPPPGEQGVVHLDDETTLPIADVVGVVPIDAGIWSRLKAYLDVGFTLAKSNKAVTLSADGGFAYRGERIGVSLDLESYYQDDANNVGVSRGTAKVVGEYYLTRWRAVALAGAEHNDELDLKLRLSLGAGAGYSAVQTNSMVLQLQAGLVANREEYVGIDPTWNLEGYVYGGWDVFRYDTPKLDLGVSLTIYPGLTDWGRVRGDFTLRVKYEVFKDFNAGLNFSFNFDTRPPESAASKTDYLATFTIGWSYRR